MTKMSDKNNLKASNLQNKLEVQKGQRMKPTRGQRKLNSDLYCYRNGICRGIKKILF